MAELAAQCDNKFLIQLDIASSYFWPAGWKNILLMLTQKIETVKMRYTYQKGQIWKRKKIIPKADIAPSAQKYVKSICRKTRTRCRMKKIAKSYWWMPGYFLLCYLWPNLDFWTHATQDVLYPFLLLLTHCSHNLKNLTWHHMTQNSWVNWLLELPKKIEQFVMFPSCIFHDEIL